MLLHIVVAVALVTSYFLLVLKIAEAKEAHLLENEKRMQEEPLDFPTNKMLFGEILL